jgi:hypothetical protein
MTAILTTIKALVEGFWPIFVVPMGFALVFCVVDSMWDWHAGMMVGIGSMRFLSSHKDQNHSKPENMPVTDENTKPSIGLDD